MKITALTGKFFPCSIKLMTLPIKLDINAINKMTTFIEWNNKIGFNSHGFFYKTK